MEYTGKERGGGREMQRDEEREKNAYCDKKRVVDLMYNNKMAS